MNWFIKGENHTLSPPPNPFGKISDIASRVNVKPVDGNTFIGVIMIGNDGKRYDAFEVVAAVLDHIDEKSK
jgi:hypothetical protein